MQRFVVVLVLSLIVTQANSQIVWSDEIEVASSSYGNNYPKIVLNGDNNPVVVWGRGSDCYASVWNGASFTTPEKPDGLIDILTGSTIGPELAAFGDTVYTVFKAKPVETGAVLVSRSVDGGLTWQVPVQVDDIGTDYSEYCHITVDDVGNPVVVFNRFDPGWDFPRFVYSYSTDFGATFSPDTVVSGWSGGSLDAQVVCECCPATVRVTSDTLVVAYRDNDANVRDIWCGISYDGISFTEGMNVDGGGWVITSCPTTGPDIEIIGSKVYSTYMSAASGQATVYWSESDLSTATGGSATEITGVVSGVTTQNYPRISAYGNDAVIAWKQASSGNQEIALVLTTDIATGFGSSYEIPVADNATSCDVILDKEKIHLVWRDYLAGTVKYKYGVYGSLVHTESAKQVELELFPNPASDVLQIRGDVSENESYIVRIIDTKGNEVFKVENVSGANLKHGIQFNVDHLPTGVYSLEFGVDGINYYSETFVRH